MSVTIWSGTTYKNADVITLSGGGAASVAIKKSDFTVWFQLSKDGTTWGATPVQVGTLGSANRQVRIVARWKAGRPGGALIVTNGFDLMWESVDFGRTWSAL